MQTPETLTRTPWFEVRDSAIDFHPGPPKAPLRMRFVLLERGSERGGAWLLGGRPVMFIPVAEA